MSTATTSHLLDRLRSEAHPITLEPAALDSIMDEIGQAPIVLLGEATHGTREFYELRALLTERLIEEQGFEAVAVEADWPDAFRANRYIRGRGGDDDGEAALADFKRFPQWMWRNRQTVEFLDRLRAINQDRASTQQVGFYGLDLYSLHRSIEAVLDYLENVDPDAAARARARYACFDHGIEDAEQYGYQASLGLRPDCEAEAVEQLVELRREAGRHVAQDSEAAADERFFAEQNARVVQHAEAYYRQMFQGRSNTWNLRDQHMVETLAALRTHLQGLGRRGRIVVWEHNSHIGDARATSMSRRGEVNVGQLVRERYGAEAVLIGFTTYDGTVAAASDWGGPVEWKEVRPAMDQSIEATLRSLDMGSLFLSTQSPRVRDALAEPLWQRAIGVIYRPHTEMQSHYFQARAARQYDGIVHVDRTQAVEPLDLSPAWRGPRLPETYPFGV